MPMNVRIPRPLVERVDDYARQRNRETGLTVTRSEAVRVLLTDALDRAGRTAPGTSKPKARTRTPRPAPEAPKKPPPKPQPPPSTMTSRTTFRFDEVDGFKATPPTGTTDKRRKRFYCATCKARTRGVETCSVCGTRRES